MSINNFTFRSIGSYIQDKTYWIPDYQREYSWDVDVEVDDFWRDLDGLVEENRDQHFLGQVVIHSSEEDKKNYIIDGQQRTSTAIIFLAVMNNLFEEIYNEYGYKAARNRCEDIRLKYIGRFSEEENELKLFLGKIDREYFMNKIQSGLPQRNEKKLSNSHNRIKNTYFFFEDKLKEKLNKQVTPGEKYNELYLYYSTFIDKMKIMYVETNDINEAFIIFETLNARGKELETSDLLKNHVFRVAGEKIDIVKSNWEKLIDRLDTIDPTKFIRHYWNSNSHFTREKNLYKRIRDNILTANKSNDFVLGLLRSSEVYKALIRPREEIYFNNPELNESLVKLNEMNASSFYPVILAMENLKFSEADIAEVTKAIEILILRNCVVAGKVANKYEVIFAKIALNISDGDYTTKDEIINRIKKEIITDEEFYNSFTVFKSKKKAIIRYILAEINNSLNSEVIIKEDTQKIHIEHIMPQNKGEWDISEEDHENYLWRIGNLTLLGSEYNRKISNKLFKDKKEMYSKSKIDISNNLANYKEWTIEEIEERQTYLAELAVGLWCI